MRHKKIISIAFSLVLLTLSASTAKAQLLSATTTDLTVSEQAILPNSGNIEVFGLNMSDEGCDTKLVSVTVTFDLPSPANFFNFSMTDIKSVALYKDNDSDGTGWENGIFSPDDTLVAGAIANAPFASNTVILTCTAPQEIPYGDTEWMEFDDFFVVINTSDSISDDDPSTTDVNEGHAFTVTIPVNGLEFNDGTTTVYLNEGSSETNNIYCEAFASDLTPVLLQHGSCYGNFKYPGNDCVVGESSRYPYSVPDEWIRPRYDNDPTAQEEVHYNHWPLSQLLPVETQTPVLGIDCGGGKDYGVALPDYGRRVLQSVTVTFTGLSSDFDPTTGLDPLRGSNTAPAYWWPFSGVALYRDTDNNGVWTTADALVEVSVGGWVPVSDGVWTVTLYPTTPTGEYIKTTWDDNDLFDYFIVIRADSGYTDDSGSVGDGVGIAPGATFTVSIGQRGVVFSDPVGGGGSHCNPSQPYITDVKPVYPLLEIHDMVADPAVSHVQRIDATSPATPIFSLNITDTECPQTIAFDGGDVLSWVTLYLHNVSETDTSDFMPLSTDEMSGLSLWKDNKAAGDIGVFDSQDTFVPVAAFGWQSFGGGVWAATLNATDWQEVLGNDTYNAANRGDDYFICVRTSDTLSYNNQFYFEIPDGGVQLAHGINAQNSGITGNTLTANFPVFLTDLTTPGHIEPLSSPTPVIGINTWDDTGNGGKLEQVIVEFYNPGGITDTNFDPRYDLLSLAAGAGSGVALYRDSNSNGIFDSTDAVIPLTEATWNVGVIGQPYFQCRLVPKTPPTIPTYDTTGGTHIGADYFVVIQTADESTYQSGDDFSVGVVSWGYEGSTWGSRALGFIDGADIQTRSYERIETTGEGSGDGGDGGSGTGGSGSSGPGSLSGCFIATACYGTPMAKEVRVLSDFRDEYLMNNSAGRFFVGAYYRTSPRIASFISEHPYLKSLVRWYLKPVVTITEKFLVGDNPQQLILRRGEQ